MQNVDKKGADLWQNLLQNVRIAAQNDWFRNCVRENLIFLQENCKNSKKDNER